MIKSQNINILLLFVSLLAVLYMIYVLAPFAENHGFLSENELPPFKDRIRYIFLLTPLIVGYSLFLVKYLRKITFMKCIVYPLSIVNLFIGFYLSVILMGGAILWLMIPSIIAPIIALPISFIVGLIKDIQFLKRHKEKRN